MMGGGRMNIICKDDSRESEEKAGEDGKSREKGEDVNRRPMEILFNWDVVFVSSSCRI